MTDPNKKTATAEDCEPLQIAPMITTYRDAEQAAFIANGVLDNSTKRDVDRLTYEQQKLQARRADDAVVESLQAICSYRAQTAKEVLIKLSIWRDAAIGDHANLLHLSLVERLVLSAHSDLSFLLDRSGDIITEDG